MIRRTLTIWLLATATLQATHCGRAGAQEASATSDRLVSFVQRELRERSPWGYRFFELGAILDSFNAMLMPIEYLVALDVVAPLTQGDFAALPDGFAAEPSADVHVIMMFAQYGEDLRDIVAYTQTVRAIDEYSDVYASGLLTVSPLAATLLGKDTIFVQRACSNASSDVLVVLRIAAAREKDNREGILELTQIFALDDRVKSGAFTLKRKGMTWRFRPLEERTRGLKKDGAPPKETGRKDDQ